MPAHLEVYATALYALSATVALFLVQFAVADVARIRGKIVPGTQVPQTHRRFVFRAERAHANSVENLGAFTLVAILAILVRAEPSYVNGLTVVFAAARAAHMLCYYLDLRLPRSAAFSVGLVATASLLAMVFAQLASG